MKLTVIYFSHLKTYLYISLESKCYLFGPGGEYGSILFVYESNSIFGRYSKYIEV